MLDFFIDFFYLWLEFHRHAQFHITTPQNIIALLCGTYQHRLCALILATVKSMTRANQCHYVGINSQHFISSHICTLYLLPRLGAKDIQNLWSLNTCDTRYIHYIHCNNIQYTECITRKIHI